MFDYLWLIPLMPLLGFAINGLLGKRYLKTFHVSWVGCSAVFISFLLSLYSFLKLLDLAPEERHAVVEVFRWIESGAFKVSLSFLIDPLSCVMILVVTGVGFLIHVYSVGYMHGDKGYYRYFAYLNLFTFFMLTLVLGANFLVMFVGWEGVGLCSYLLIGYWFHKQSAANAGKKAFVVNRVGDFGFALGMMFIFVTFGSLDFGHVFSEAPHTLQLGGAVATAITLLLFLGACGKSAQIPLYVWLPDAMEGPTPVSALIHAATMVTAGVYMVARCHVLFELAPFSMKVVAVVGALTALFSASIGLCQTDIKKVLAYSTVSQLGYMFLACGVGAFTAGIFHLATHAFFKGLLFLGSGSVIHALSGEQDMRKMGGLFPHLKTTGFTFWVATLAIAGIPPFAGFFSKDEILWKVFSAPREVFGSLGLVLWVIGAVAAFMTAFYMFRLVFLTFHGKSRVSHEAAHHLHESPKVMTVPLSILAFFSAIAGFMGLPLLPKLNAIHNWLAPVMGHGGAPHHASLQEKAIMLASYTATGGHEAAGEAHASLGLEVSLMVVSVLIALSGISLAYIMYIKKPDLPERLAQSFKTLYRYVYNKYYVDEIYQALIIEPCKSFANFLWAFDATIIDGIVNGVSWLTIQLSSGTIWNDLHVVDGAVNGLAILTKGASEKLKLVQTGKVQNYGLAMALGLFALVAVYVLFK